MLGLDFTTLMLAAAASCTVALLLVFTGHWHRRWTADFEASGVQKHHKGSPPRVGVLALAAGLLAAIAGLWQLGSPETADSTRLLALLALCSIPAVASGLVEDITKAVRARWRLLASMLSAGVGILVFGAVVPGVGVPWLDPIVAWWPVGVAVTVLMVAGFTNAMNIMDGLNGLASGLALLMLGAMAYVAHGVNDAALVQACLVVAAVVLGFVVVNFPRGPIFLGDGGAYFLGFVIAQLMVLLVVRHPGEVSPWFCVAVAFHPTMETVFSILRRKFLHPQRRDATAPDRLHLHTLVYRRKVVMLMRAYPWAEAWVGNALAALLVLAVALPPVLAATLFPASHLWQMGVVAVGVGLYLYWFMRLVRLRPGPPGGGSAVRSPMGHTRGSDPLQPAAGRPRS